MPKTYDSIKIFSDFLIFSEVKKYVSKFQINYVTMFYIIKYCHSDSLIHSITKL